MYPRDEYTAVSIRVFVTAAVVFARNGNAAKTPRTNAIIYRRLI